MQYFQAIGATAPDFQIGDRVLSSIVDPDEGLFTCSATIAGLVWNGSTWDYALLFDGGNYYIDFGWGIGELTPLEESSRASSDFPNSPIKTAETIAA